MRTVPNLIQSPSIPRIIRLLILTRWVRPVASLLLRQSTAYVNQSSECWVLCVALAVAEMATIYD